jgi:putative ABC transport system substrate-binding protein
MDRVPVLAAELVRSKPDVIVTAANPLIVELKKATQTIPIVMATGADPVGSGIVASLARPGGNITGLTGFYESTPGKMLELASALISRGARVGAIVEANTVFARGRFRNDFSTTAKTLGLNAEMHEVATPDDIVRVVDVLARDKPSLLIVLPGPMLFSMGVDVVRRCESLRIPVIYPFEEMVEAGGLMSYAPNAVDNYRRAARYVDRILRGERAADMPIEQPTRLWLSVNMPAARALGIRVPQSIMQRADRIVD